MADIKLCANFHPLSLHTTVNIWRRSGLKVRFPSPYATKIGKFIEFFYLLFAPVKFYEFSGANTPKH